MSNEATYRQIISALQDERAALAAQLAEGNRIMMAGNSAMEQALVRIRELDAALREIAGGLMPEDSVADHHNRYEMCVGRLCKIARDSLTSLETKTAPGFCPECLMTGGHKLSCSKAETKGEQHGT